MATATAESVKAEALRMIDAGESQAVVAKAVGVDRGTVCRWVQKRDGRKPRPANDANASAAGANGASAAPVARPVVSDEVAALKARVRELEAANRELTDETNVLRRALGYVARGVK